MDVRRRRMLVASLAAITVSACSNGARADDVEMRRERLREALRQRREARGSQIPVDIDTTRIADSRAQRGPFTPIQIEDVWSDAARGGRTVPWRAYLPQNARGLSPVVIYSHGGGGTRASGASYGEHIASHGFVSLHLQHAGSDRDAFRNNPQQISEAARNPAQGAPRFLDVLFAYQQLQGLADGTLASAIDKTAVGIAGHSLGAITTQIAAGQVVTGFEQTLAVPALKGAIALSPSPPRALYGDEQTAFSRMFMPLFHMTGTLDDAPNGDFEAPARRIPFDRISNVDQWLMILEGANHFTFGGDSNPQLRGQSFGYPALPRHHDLIKVGALAFWRWTLKRDANERAFLDRGGFQSLLARGDTFEARGARQ